MSRLPEVVSASFDIFSGAVARLVEEAREQLLLSRSVIRMEMILYYMCIKVLTTYPSLILIF